MDSLRAEGTPSLKSDVTAIVGSIKHLWGENYSQSKIDISRYITQYISTPMQKTSHDCGYFMLKFIESWDGRRLVQLFSHTDIPAARKLQLLKWLEREDNKIAWHSLLFSN